MENFTYERTWEEIYEMLDKAEKKQNQHLMALQNKKLEKSIKIEHMRNYKALEGVVKSLRWVLGDKDIIHPLD